jgi:predicted protein tyrosine phosphatase
MRTKKKSTTVSVNKKLVKKPISRPKLTVMEEIPFVREMHFELLKLESATTVTEEITQQFEMELANMYNYINAIENKLGFLLSSPAKLPINNAIKEHPHHKEIFDFFDKLDEKRKGISVQNTRLQSIIDHLNKII